IPALSQIATLGVPAHKISSFVSLSLDGRRLVLTINDTALLYGCYVLVTYVAAQPARPHFSFTLFPNIHIWFNYCYYRDSLS
ncbi:MAG: hypothetical protein ACYDHG_10390, partial [Desulfomonilaceae bacterium]